MASTQRMPVPSLSTASSYGSCRVDAAPPEQFPAGLRVLVVDDDVTCLKILERMLHRCRYRVTTCCQARIALSLVRERKGDYDLVISDVYMPDMDGFKLLELVGLEMDLPVIMMSADGSTSAVMKGIKHGACDYLIKPVRIEELKNIWQHVVRKNLNENKEPEHSGSVEDSDRHPRVIDDADYSSSINGEADVTSRSQKKKRDTNEEDDDGDLDNEDPSASKKPRVVWSVELHQQFVSAVNQLGFDQAVPKRILELMNVPGLTRENVASHLQKFRLYLKRLRGVAEHQSGFSNSFCTLLESNAKASSLDRTDFQALAASGQIPPQTLAALQAELFGQPSGSLVLPAIDQPILLHASTQGSKCIPIEPGIAFGQPLMKCQSNLSKQLHQSNIAVEDMPSEFSSWSSDHHGTTGFTRNLGGVNNTQNDNMLMQISQQQLYPVLAKSHHAINVQPSCLVSPFQSSDSFQVGNSPFPLTENSRITPFHSSISLQVGSTTVTTHQNSKCNNSGTVVGYSPLSSASNDVPWSMGQVSDGGFKNVGVLNGFTTPGSLSSLQSCSARTDRSTSWRVHNPTANVGSASILPGRLPNLCILGSETNTGALPGQVYAGNLGFVGKVTHISSRFAVDDVSPTNKLCHKKTCITDDADRVKQEFHLDSVDGSKFSSTLLPCFSANDTVDVQSKDGSI